jgi:hypothetical protein
MPAKYCHVERGYFPADEFSIVRGIEVHTPPGEEKSHRVDGRSGMVGLVKGLGKRVPRLIPTFRRSRR